MTTMGDKKMNLKERWRLSFCVAIGFGLMLIAFIAGAVWFNAGTLFG